MPDFDKSSAYPHPDEFAVKRPSYHEQEDGFFRATIDVQPFKVTGQSRTKAGARRAALYEAQKTYHSYHPSFEVQNPYPETFTDREGMEWHRTSAISRAQKGDYTFVDQEGEEDYVDIETMLMWDIRPVEEGEEEEEEEEMGLPGF